MKQMKTLTLPNGVTYEIVDEYAREHAKAAITEEDKAQLVEDVLDMIPEIEGGSFVKDGPAITATFPLDDGSNTVSVITLDENGIPSKIVTDGVERTFTWEGFDDIEDGYRRGQERLIKRIAVNTADVMSCVIDKDETGNAFSLSDAFIKVDCPTASVAATGEIVLYDASNKRAFGYSSSIANATKRYVHKAWATRKNYGYRVDIANTGNPIYNLTDDASQTNEPVVKISLTATAALPIGTVIEIWGV